MATMEKPKLKKKNDPKYADEVVAPVTKSGEVVSQICINSVTNVPVPDVTFASGKRQKLNEIRFKPTAPIFENETSSHAVSTPKVLFPDLKSKEAIEYHAIAQTYNKLADHVKLNINPFNELELNQIGQTIKQSGLFYPEI